MTTGRLARRYAMGLWEYTLSVNESEVVVKEIQSIIENIEQNKHLQLFLKTPIIEVKKKIQIIKEIFKSYSPTVNHFLILMIKHHREDILLNTAKEILRLNDEHNGIQRVEITSAVILDQETITKILESESKINLEKVVVKNTVDKTLIGGYILRIEDQQIDASIKTKLNNIKKKLGEKVY